MKPIMFILLVFAIAVVLTREAHDAWDNHE